MITVYTAESTFKIESTVFWRHSLRYYAFVGEDRYLPWTSITKIEEDKTIQTCTRAWLPPIIKLRLKSGGVIIISQEENLTGFIETGFIERDIGIEIATVNKTIIIPHWNITSIEMKNN